MYTVSADILDRAGPIPIYLQLANWTEGMIVDGHFAVGAKLPSESWLARQFRLNRNTVRQAIALLVQSGMVEKRKGLGNFVRRGRALSPIHQLGRLTSFVDDFDANVIEFEDALLEKERITAPADLAAKLGIAPG
jgi:DNA-binding GntR family transcriptional regulator